MMKKLLTTCSALAFGAVLMAGCSEQGGGQVGESPSRDRTPSASPPTATSPATRPDTTTPPPGGTTGTGTPSTTTPSGSGSSR